MMMMPQRVALLSLVVALAACDDEVPRAVSYFEANAQERAAVLQDCADGSQRGLECGNARYAEQRSVHARETDAIDEFLSPYANPG